MNNKDIANLIKENYRFIKTPSESEVSRILERLSDTTTAEEFYGIVCDVVWNTTSFYFESIDMSASKNILLQIKKATGKSGK
jgi:hypothetical protein